MIRAFNGLWVSGIFGAVRSLDVARGAGFRRRFLPWLPSLCFHGLRALALENRVGDLFNARDGLPGSNKLDYVRKGGRIGCCGLGRSWSAFRRR